MIGLFDSGSGGVSVLREVVKLLPRERFVYFSDNAHCPYGEKTPEYIRERASEVTREEQSLHVRQQPDRHFLFEERMRDNFLLFLLPRHENCLSP